MGGWLSSSRWCRSSLPPFSAGTEAQPLFQKPNPKPGSQHDAYRGRPLLRPLLSPLLIIFIILRNHSRASPLNWQAPPANIVPIPLLFPPTSRAMIFELAANQFVTLRLHRKRDQFHLIDPCPPSYPSYTPPIAATSLTRFTRFVRWLTAPPELTPLAPNTLLHHHSPC